MMRGRFARLLVVSVVASCSSEPASKQQIKNAPPPPEPPVSTAIARAFDVGGAHACARIEDGRVACWGSNEWGLVGDGTREDRFAAVIVPQLADIAGVSVGGELSCAWSKAGAAWCWGGSGPKPPLAPVRVLEGQVVEEIVVGYDIGCARLRDGAVACWPDGDSDPFPVFPIEAAHGATVVAVGKYQTLARLPDGKVIGWLNSYFHAPKQVFEIPALRGATTLVADRGFRGGYAGRSADGRWSVFHVDELPKGTLAPLGPEGATMLSFDQHRTCTVVGGAVRCAPVPGKALWESDITSELVVPDTTGAREVRVSPTLNDDPSLVCASFDDRSLKCWGPASWVGGGGRNTIARATDVPGIDDAVELETKEASGALACVRRKSKRVSCWGRMDAKWDAGSADGKLERAAYDLAIPDAAAIRVGEAGVCVRRAATPAAMTCVADKLVAKPHATSLVPSTFLVMGGTCAIVRGQIACKWTEPKDRDDKAPDKDMIPASVGKVRRAWMDESTGCAEQMNGKLACWFYDQTDDSATFNQTVASVIAADVVDAAFDSEHICFVRKAGFVECIAQQPPFKTATVIQGIANAVEVTAGFGGFCALQRDGKVACWSESFRQAGEPPRDGRFGKLATIEGIDDAIRIAGHEFAVCALRRSGRVACWGVRDYLGTNDSSIVGPTRVTGVRL